MHQTVWFNVIGRSVTNISKTPDLNEISFRNKSVHSIILVIHYDLL